MFGFAFGFVTRQVLKLIKRGGHKAPEQLSFSVAMAYLVFYFAQIGRTPIIEFDPFGSELLFTPNCFLSN